MSKTTKPKNSKAEKSLREILNANMSLAEEMAAFSKLLEDDRSLDSKQANMKIKQFGKRVEQVNKALKGVK